MLWLYDHSKYVQSYRAGIDFGRQKVDPRAVRVKVVSYNVPDAAGKLGPFSPSASSRHWLLLLILAKSS